MVPVIVLCACVFLCLLCHKFLKFRQPPSHPGGVVGNTYFMGFQPGSLWDKVKQLSEECTRCGGITRLLPTIDTYYLVTDPDAIMGVLNMRLQKGSFQTFWDPWLGDGSVNAQVSVWRPHRKLLNPMFTQRVLDEYLVIFNSQASKLVDTWMEYAGQAIDPLPTLAVFNLETICLTTFGFTEDKKSLQEYSKAVNDMNWITRYRFERFWLHYGFIFRWTSTKAREQRATKIIHRMSSKLINKRKSVLAKNQDIKNGFVKESNNPKLFIDMLLELQAQNHYTEKQVREEVDTFLFGGHDSVSTTIMYTLVLLGSYPRVQEKVYAEVKDVLGSSLNVKKDDLSKLVYLEAVLKESMRLYPYAPYVSRSIDEDVILRNCTLSAGSTLFVLLYGTHRHQGWWGPDAEEFRPERWLETTVPDHPGAFLAFSWGKRGCIGKPYAMLLLKTTLSYLVRNFKFTADHTKMKLELNVVLKPLSGHHIILEKR
ncbi:cytochrome p450 domain-containing protein [Phthorimaea operculella]|nr:cytochrome p450 domain-containing protein [Phthorimaea operculella]